VGSRLWTPGFIFLFIAVFFGYAGQQLVLPTFPLYVTELGGTPTVAGLILAAFSITSFPLRPFVGYLSDSWSARGVLTLGMLILSVTAFGLFIPMFGVLAVVNALRGVGWAALNTAGYVVLARVAPRERRGEASGYYNLATSVPIALAPALALSLVANPGYSFGAVFLLAAACGAAAFVVAWSLKLVAPQLEAEDANRRATAVRPSFTGFVDKRVFLAAGLLLTLTVTQVTTGAFLPLYARSLGVDNIGIYFIETGVIGIVAQVLGGRFLDRGHRGGWIVAGFAIMIVSMLLLFAAQSLPMILVAGFFNALGNAILNTILLVLAMDLADPERPGAGMATYSISYQLGAALGAPVFGFVIEHLGFGAMFLGSVLALSVGLVWTALRWPVLTHPQAAAARGGSRV
jgi:MFS family permease